MSSGVSLVGTDVHVLSGVERLVHAGGDVLGLLVQGYEHGAGVSVESLVAGVVADLDDLLPHDGRDVEVGVGGYLSGDQDVAGAGYGLAGDAAQGVLSETGVEDGVADCVAEFVGVAFGHGF